MLTIDIEHLRSLLSYDQLTGIMTWKTRHNNNKRGGKIQNGYVRIKIEGRFYEGHRVAWALHYGAWPDVEIDHEDGNKANNSIKNLRIATKLQNQRNRRLQKNNTTGYKGVIKHNGTEKWGAQIRFGGRQHRLGTFESPQIAAHEYNKAAIKHHGEFAVLNPIGEPK